FFCAFTSPSHAEAAARVIDTATSSDPTVSQRIIHELVTGILGWRQEVRERTAREIEAKHRHIGALDAALFGFKDAIAGKDTHIGKLDDAIAALKNAIVERDA